MEMETNYPENNQFTESPGGDKLHFKIGTWIYGDLEHAVDGVSNPHECKAKCDENLKCHHWMYNMDLGRCDLKGDGGNFVSGTDHWIVGIY